ncbi:MULTISPECIES: hypothetical protein [unclassified Streptococcus]|nr:MULTISPECIES: hypothetical protein [unclassified Streptococcus]
MELGRQPEEITLQQGELEQTSYFAIMIGPIPNVRLVGPFMASWTITLMK